MNVDKVSVNKKNVDEIYGWQNDCRQNAYRENF